MQIGHYGLIFAILIGLIYIFFFLLRRKNQIEEFDASITSKDYEKAEVISQKHWQKSVSKNILLRKILIKSLNTEQSENTITSIQTALNFHPNLKFSALRELSHRMQLDSFKLSLDQLFRIAVLRRTADIINGKTPDLHGKIISSYSLPLICLTKANFEAYPFKEENVSEELVKMMMGKQYLPPESRAKPVTNADYLREILKKDYGARFVFDVNTELSAARANAQIQLLMDDQNHFRILINTNFSVQNIFTGKSSFWAQNFPLDDIEVMRVLFALDKQRLHLILDMKVRLFNQTLKTQLIKEVQNVCVFLMEVFYNTTSTHAELFENVKDIFLQVRYSPVIFWRQSASEVGLGATTHQYRIHSMMHSPLISCNYSYKKEDFYTKFFQIKKSISEKSQDHIQVSF